MVLSAFKAFNLFIYNISDRKAYSREEVQGLNPPSKSGRTFRSHEGRLHVMCEKCNAS